MLFRKTNADPESIILRDLKNVDKHSIYMQKTKAKMSVFSELLEI